MSSVTPVIWVFGTEGHRRDGDIIWEILCGWRFRSLWITFWFFTLIWTNKFSFWWNGILCQPRVTSHRFITQLYHLKTMKMKGSIENAHSRCVRFHSCFILVHYWLYLVSFRWVYFLTKVCFSNQRGDRHSILLQLPPFIQGWSTCDGPCHHFYAYFSLLSCANLSAYWISAQFIKVCVIMLGDFVFLSQKRERFNDFRRDAALLQLQRSWGKITEPSHSAAKSQQVTRNKLEKTHTNERPKIWK